MGTPDIFTDEDGNNGCSQRGGKYDPRLELRLLLRITSQFRVGARLTLILTLTLTLTLP